MATRSRRGCATCRKRKKKCDEARPECSQCVSRGVPCGGYAMRLTWNDTNATPTATSSSRGVIGRVGISYPSSSSPMSISSSPGAVAAGSPGVNPTAGAGVGAATPGNRDSGFVRFVVTPMPPESSRRATDEHNLQASHPRVGSDDRHISSSEAEQGPILTRFLNEGIHRLYASTADESVVEAIKDLFPRAEVLRLVCVALQEVISNGPTVSALEMTGRALEMFRRRVTEQASPDREELFMTGSWICTLHLIQGLPWTSTFYQFLEVCHVGDDPSQLRPNPRYHLGMRHQMETISVLDFSNFVLGRMSPSRGLWVRFRQLQSTWGDRHDGGVEPVTGLPRTLLDLLVLDSPGDNADSRYREESLWSWFGQIGDALWEGQLWDCYRYAGILAIRHQRALIVQKHGIDQAAPSIRLLTDTEKVPPTDIVLFRLLSSLNAMLNERFHLGRHSLLQLQHLALYPLFYASLQVSALKATGRAWRDDLMRMREQVLDLNPGATKHTLILFQILDEAWQSGRDGFDADDAARRRGVEITII